MEGMGADPFVMSAKAPALSRAWRNGEGWAWCWKTGLVLRNGVISMRSSWQGREEKKGWEARAGVAGQSQRVEQIREEVVTHLARLTSVQGAKGDELFCSLYTHAVLRRLLLLPRGGLAVDRAGAAPGRVGVCVRAGVDWVALGGGSTVFHLLHLRREWR